MVDDLSRSRVETALWRFLLMWLSRHCDQVSATIEKRMGGSGLRGVETGLSPRII